MPSHPSVFCDQFSRARLTEREREMSRPRAATSERPKRQQASSCFLTRVLEAAARASLQLAQVGSFVNVQVFSVPCVCRRATLSVQ